AQRERDRGCRSAALHKMSAALRPCSGGTAMSITLRPYQDELVQKIFREFDSGEHRVLTVLPTGGGKTVVFCAVTRDHNNGGTLIISHRREIVAQTCAQLDAIGMHYSVIQA